MRLTIPALAPLWCEIHCRRKPEMGEISIVHWIIVISYVVLITVPVARILRRVGLSGWWCVIALIPVLNMVGLWVLAYVRWPAVDPASS
jgi:uncharacterized membrane protein YhaH (DUF805 family)